MADSEPDTVLIEDRTEVSHLPCDGGLITRDQIRSLHGNMNEDILQQSLDDGNDFDSSSIAYAVATADGTTVGDSATVENGHRPTGLGQISVVTQSLADNVSYPLEPVSSLGSDAEQILTHTPQTDFVTHMNGTKRANFPHVSTSTNGAMINSEPQTVLNCVSDETYVTAIVEEQSMPLPDTSNGTVDVPATTGILEHSTVVDGVVVGLRQTDDDVTTDILNEAHSQAIKVSAPQGIPITQDVLQSVFQQVKAQQLTQQSSSDKSQESTQNENPQSNNVSFTLVSPNQQNTHQTHAPLGSSQNPIRIIQQGNRYTPMQQLTPDQLQQIMQVVRQQHVNKSTQDNGGTVIFNPVTNTKIMYRVIYPSELHKAQIPDTTYRVVRPSTLSQEQQTNTPHQKRAYRKRKDYKETASSGVTDVVGCVEDDKGGGDGSELSKEEKDERKKHRPRTRSGRVSKPPKHMVQDYKQLHVLDWDEDYDDSDGGYSDFKHSDGEGKARKNREEEIEESPDLFQGLGSGKPKNYKCQTCEKCYIGQAWLTRHYRLNPDHLKSDCESLLNTINRSLDGEDSSKDASINQDGNSSRASDPGPDMKTNGIENFSEDSNTQDSLNSNGACSPVVRRGRGRGVYRGRWAHLKYNAQMRKKNKLREFAKRCSDEDLMEVLFPRLVGSISSWEFLMMKSEKGGSRPQVDIIYKEFDGLLRHVKQVCEDYLKPINIEEDQKSHAGLKTIKVQDPNQAACLGLKVGMYRVEEMLPDDSNTFSSLHNKLSAATISTFSTDEAYGNSIPLDKREVIVAKGESSFLKRKSTSLSPTEVNFPPMKKQKSSSFAPVNHGHILSSFGASISEMKREADIKKHNGSEIKIHGSPAVSTLSSVLFRPTSVPAAASSSIVTSKPATTTLLSQLSKLESSTISSVIPTSVSHSQPTISYLITTSHDKTATTSTSRAQTSQLVPVVLNSNLSSASTSSSQVVPVMFSTKNTTVINPHQTIMVAAPGMVGNKPVHSSGAMPIVLAAPGSQIPGDAMVLAPTNPGTGQHILIRHSSKQPNVSQQQKTKVLLASQPSTTKSTLSLLGSASTISSQSGHRTTSQITRFSSHPKPAEVKVSRRLFHEATTSSSMLSTSLQQTSQASSSVSNGHSTTTNAPASQLNIKQDYTKDFVKGASLANLEAQKISTLSLPSNSSMTTNMTDMTESQFISGGVTSGGDEDMDTSFDISASVLSSIGFSGDELAPLNTSCSSSVLLSSTNTVMVNEMATPSISLTYSKAADGTVLSTDTNVSVSDLSLMNGARSEFSEISPPSVTLKDSIITNSSLVSSPNFMTSVADLIDPPAKPSSPLMSSPSKDNMGISTVSLNLPSIDSCETLTSQMLKSEETPAIMNDLDGLSFSDQATLPTAEQLGGVATVLQGHSVVNILPEQITSSYESSDSLLQTSNSMACDDLETVGNSCEEDGQLLLTEGSSIYQTEDGMLIIESADGSRYQLTSTQGLPLETVQALISGNFGEVNGDGVTDGTLQTDLHLQ